MLRSPGYLRPWPWRSDCHGTKETGVDRMPWCEILTKWDNWMLRWLGYLWPWPLTFKVKLYLGNGRPKCHGTKGTGVDRMTWCQTLRKWVNWMLRWLGYLWPWIFKVKLYLRNVRPECHHGHGTKGMGVGKMHDCHGTKGTGVDRILIFDTMTQWPSRWILFGFPYGKISLDFGLIFKVGQFHWNFVWFSRWDNFIGILFDFQGGTISQEWNGFTWNKKNTSWWVVTPTVTHNKTFALHLAFWKLYLTSGCCA